MSDFIANRDGICVTPEGLDRLLPRDNREVDLSDPGYDILFTAKGRIIPDCAPGTLTYEEQVAAEGYNLTHFVFNGETLDPSIHTVPLWGSLPYLLAGVLMLWIRGKK